MPKTKARPAVLDWRDPSPDPRVIRTMLSAPLDLRARAIQAADGEAEHEFVISTSGKKRDMGVLELDGLDVSNYLRNPVVNYVHDFYGLPIGLTSRLHLTSRRMTGRMRWAPTEQAERIRTLVDGGFLRAASVSWQPIEMEALTDDDGRWTGWHWIRSDMLEWSVCPVPADPQAVRPGPKAQLEQDGERAAMARAVDLRKFGRYSPEPGAWAAAFPEFVKWHRSVAGLWAPEFVDERGEARPGIDETDDFWHYEIRDPDDFVRIRQWDLKEDKPRIFARGGPLKSDPDGGAVLQSLLFPKEDGWDREKVQDWVDEHEDDLRTADWGGHPAQWWEDCPACKAFFARGRPEEPARPTQTPAPHIGLNPTQAHGNIRGVVPYDATPALDEGRDWDADAAVARIARWAGGPAKEDIDFGKFKRGFGWFDAEGADNITSYKLPHHDVDGGELKTHWRGTAAAMGVLLGARGGVDIPDDDRRGVYNHLSKHYAQYDKEPPEFRHVQNQPLRDLPDEVAMLVVADLAAGRDGLLEAVAAFRSAGILFIPPARIQVVGGTTAHSTRVFVDGVPFDQALRIDWTVAATTIPELRIVTPTGTLGIGADMATLEAAPKADAGGNGGPGEQPFQVAAPQAPPRTEPGIDLATLRSVLAEAVRAEVRAEIARATGVAPAR